MRLLLDTCTFVWLSCDPAGLSESARRALDDTASELLLSDVSVWEICLKWQAGKLELPAPPRVWVEDQRRIWALGRATLDLEHLYRGSELPGHHRDPFDRALISQALAQSLTIVTPDPAIRAYPVAVLW